MSGQAGSGNEAIADAQQLDKNYMHAFDAFDVPEDMRSTDHFFLETNSEGVPFAIPREFYGPADEKGKRDIYTLHQEGYAVSTRAWVSPFTKMGSLTIVHAGAYVDARGSIGKLCTIGKGTQISKGVEIDDLVKIGEDSKIEGHAKIGEGSFLGKKVSVLGGAIVGGLCRLYDGVRVGAVSVLGDSVNLHEGSFVDGDAVLDYGTTVQPMGFVGRKSQLGAYSLVIEGTRVSAETKTKPNTIIASSQYRRRIVHGL